MTDRHDKGDPYFGQPVLPAYSPFMKQIMENDIFVPTPNEFTVQLMPGQNVCSKSTDRVVSVRLEVSMDVLRGVVGRTFTFKALREDLQNRAQAVELDIVEVI